MKLTLRIGTLELPGIREAELPALLQRLEARLQARYEGLPASARIDHVPVLELAAMADTSAVADAIVDALLAGPLVPTGEAP